MDESDLAFPNPDTQFPAGQSGNPAGRPRKYVSALKEQGYKLSEINDALEVLMSMSAEELKEVENNEQATMLDRTVARAILKGFDKGSLYSLETLLSRRHGKPVEKREEKIEGTIKIKATFNEEGKTEEAAG